MTEARIFRATADDAEIVARIHVAAWRESYASIMPPEALNALNVEEQAARWRDVFRGEASDVTPARCFWRWARANSPAVLAPVAVSAVRALRRRVFRSSFRRFIYRGGRSGAALGAR